MEKKSNRFILLGKFPEKGVVPFYLDNDYDPEHVDEDSIVEINDAKDRAIFDALLDKVNKAGDEDAVQELFNFLDKFNHDAALYFLLHVGHIGEAWKRLGDDFEIGGLDTHAVESYEQAALVGYRCGECKLGRYYAEGKGCKKNLILAKKWLKEAAEECSEAEQYLDQYGLR